MNETSPNLFSTVSRDFIGDWLSALEPLSTVSHFRSLLERSELPLDQDINLYQLAAVETGGEMLRLRSRSIRTRTLEQLLTSVREATSLSSALYRFSTFWILLLDDNQFDSKEADRAVTLMLMLLPNPNIASALSRDMFTVPDPPVPKGFGETDGASPSVAAE